MIYKSKINTETNRVPLSRRSSVDLDGIRDFTITVDISLLLKDPDSNESQTTSPPDRNQTRSTSVQSSITQPEIPNYAAAVSAAGGKRSMGAHPSESPAKKQSKWSADEDALIIDLRGSGMKWEDISKRLPGRSAISCRLHYQNYLERRSEWDEERKNKLARLYERFKQEMWSKVAEEMAVPWRAAEAMHWQLGENDMARRAGVVPFSLSSVTLDAPSSGSRASPARGHSYSQSTSSTMNSASGGSRYSRPGTAQGNPNPRGVGATRTIAARRESTPRSVPPTSPTDGLALAAIGGGGGMMMGQGRGGYLPSLSEMTTGMSPYSTPAYAMSMPAHSSGYSSGYSSPGPGPLLPAIGMLGQRNDGKRRGSPEGGTRDSIRRRQ
ncbi:uncharacterized protein EAF02_008677 [Botrytis sinoallii]|uniref:uncharacterized protein n=1 Tax=Botrytis sinoallii TaxID=1463999 RepID=UPI0018FF516D|nr:uncharacterized protein EAF02_008677 [Botrytis sinoallii]KAF7874700.1 hypothetical protein EAF02_008677 [Botrytis sinoallii]